MKNFKFKLGEKAKDKVTGFTGIIISRADYLTGCNQYCIRPKGKTDSYPDAKWFDEPEIQSLGGEILVLENKYTVGYGLPEVESSLPWKTGGPKRINKTL